MPEAYNSIHTGEQIDQGISVILNNDIPGVVNEAKKFAEASKASSEESAGHATTSENFSKTSESFAKGGTGTRPGEDTDNAKYYSELAAGSAGGVVGALTFNGRSGNVMPEKGDYGPDQGNATLDDRGKIFKNQIPEEVLAANVPRSSGPPSDPDTQLYIDTSLANDDFYTAGEMDTKLTKVNSKFDSYSTTEQMNTQIDTKVSDAIATIPAREPGINHNFIVNPWFQVLQTPCVYNEVRDRWYYGYTNAPHAAPPPEIIYAPNGIHLHSTDSSKEFICTSLLIQKIDFPSNKLTLSARYLDATRVERTTSFTFDSNLAYDTPIRSNITNYIQFQVIRKVWDTPDPNLSGLTYDKWLVYFKAFDARSGHRSRIDIHNVKLELGPNSTIDQDVPLSYAEDLMQCQRFRMIYQKSQIFGEITTAQTGWLTLPLKTSLIMKPNAQNVVIPRIYLANGKKLESGYNVDYREPDTLKMDDTSVTYPIRFNPPLSTSDFVPFCCIDTELSLTTFSYPHTDTEYVFPDDPT